MANKNITKHSHSSIVPSKKSRVIPSLSSVALIGSCITMAVSGFSFMLLGVAIGSICTGIASFIYNHIKEERYLPQGKGSATIAPLPLKRQLNRCKLHEHLKMEQSIDDALDQLKNIEKKSTEFSKLLASKFNPGELSWNRFESVRENMSELVESNIQEFIRILERAAQIQDKDLRNELLSGALKGISDNNEALLGFEKLFVSLSSLKNIEEDNQQIHDVMKELENLVKRSTKFK